MAQNIRLEYPNFTLTPQAGTFGSINTADSTTRLRIKNTSGGLINDYTLSANMHPDNELVGVEYCGPLNLTGVINGVTFITVERVPDYDSGGSPLSTSSQCIIKRWEVNSSFSLLNLKQQIIKYTTGSFYYDIRGMAVEHYHRTFDFAQPSGQSYIDINSSLRIKTGDTLFLGPSTDTDNVGATEKVTVSNVVGSRIYLNSPTHYQYVFGDPITFFNNVYLISDKGLNGDTRYGTIFKHDIYSGSRLEYTTGGQYARLKGARWSVNVAAIAGITSNQLMFIRPYDSYLNWKSMFLTNVYSNDVNFFDVYDVAFDEYNIYKLAKNATSKDDAGTKSTETWSTYNYQQDTLLPYTHNVSIYMKQQYTIGPDGTNMYVQARDQFGVALRDVNINIYTDGSDGGAEFDPLNGQAVTDINGKAKFGYTPSGLYTGPTLITVRADKSSEFTGSEYCWNSILVDGRVEIVNSFGAGAMFQDKQQVGAVSGRQLSDPFMTTHPKHTGTGNETTVPTKYIICYSFFGQPGGNWIGDSDYSSSINTCWPWFQKTPARTDGPQDNVPNNGCGWSCITYPPPANEPGGNPPVCSTTGRSPRANFITQVLGVTQFGVAPDYYTKNPLPTLGASTRPLILKQPLDFLQYYRNTTCGPNCKLEDGKPVPSRMFQLDSESEFHFSQLNMSKHSFWVDGIYTSTLDTNVHLDQFIFVEDAVPSFWSEKNPRETDIWIRLRPFAFSLDGDTLKFYIREVWTVGDAHYDTGYYDVIARYGWPPNNDKITINYFDAGGGTLGVEFTYDNPDIYHHNALVYVHIEVNDTSAEPNYIYTDYWFRIIPDYKSPYLLNEDPGREEDQVALDTQLYFEIKDDGEGIDIDTLEVFLNSRIIYHAGQPYNPATVIEEVSLNHYKVTIDLPYTLQYGKSYSVGVTVRDLSDNENILRDSYRFYTRQSEIPWFTAFDPKLCKRGMPRFRDVSFMVLSGGDGVDPQTIRIQVHNKDVTRESKITPVIYRIS